MTVTLNLIASYAKSGSNWTRMVLENYLLNGDKPANIWATKQVPNGFSRAGFEGAMGVSTELLTAAELWQLMPLYLQEISQRSAKPLYYKIHDANLDIIPAGLFPQVRVLYLIRNPKDVAVSYSHHFGMSLDKTISRFDDPNALFNDPAWDGSNHGLLPIRSNTWPDHVAGWVDQGEFPVEVLRFEDMVTNPMVEFSRMIRLFVGELDEDRLIKAIKFSHIDEFRQQEKNHHRIYHSHQGESFFRKGKAGAWKEELSKKQTQLIEERYASLIKRFGYSRQSK